MLLCARQELALWGHDESAQSRNHGNFLEFLNAFASHDPIIKQKMVAVGNASYTSLEIQNSLLQIMGGMIREIISNAVNKAVHFSILVDENKYVGKVEQLSVVLRYVNKDEDVTVNERFCPSRRSTGRELNKIYSGYTIQA